MWFHTCIVNELKDVLTVLGLPLSGKKEELTKRILDNLDRVYQKPGATVVQLRVLDSWFLNPKFTGSKECTIGLENETPTLKFLPAFLEQADWDDFTSGTISSFTVSDVRELGLLENKAHNELVASCDAMAQIHVECRDGTTLNETCMVEIKTRANASTIAAEKKLLDEKVVDRLSHAVDKDSLATNVRDASHRCQVAHEHSCPQVRFVVFVVAEPGAILRVVLSERSLAWRERYLALLHGLYQRYVQPILPPAPAPESLKQADLGFAGDLHNVRLGLMLRDSVAHLVRSSGGLHAARQLVPLAVSVWNKIKGGTDQMSRFLEEFHAKFEDYLAPTPRLLCRQLKWILEMLDTRSGSCDALQQL